MPLNKLCLGKKYTGETSFKVIFDMSKKYAESTQDYNTRYFDEKNPVTPPMFSVVFQGTAMVKAFFDPELQADYARLVHGEQDLYFYKLAVPGDEIFTESEIVDIQDKGEAGETFSVQTLSKNQNGEDITKGIYTFFIRGKKKADVKATEVKKQEIPSPIFTHLIKVRPDQSLIYAEASGDRNPIHTQDDFAKSVGLPGVILQGLCTMAFCQKAIINELLAGDPTRLKRLKVRFSHIVLPGDILTVKGWIIETSREKGIIGFVAENQHSSFVITNGIAEII